MFIAQSTHLAIAVTVLLAVSTPVEGFAPSTTPQKSQHLSCLSMSQKQQDPQQQHDLIRATTMGAVSLMAAATVLLSPVNTMVLALEEEITAVVDTSPVTTTVTAPAYSITKCDVSSKSPTCVSTSNVRQLDLYVPPWTFNTNADEAMARLKGAIEAEPLNTIVSSEDSSNRRLLVDSKRSKLGGTSYRLEFLINESDNVITFRASAPSDVTGPDFGLQRRRLSEIQERSSFGVMGETLNSADTKSTADKGNGPLGQLKAFYGLQSGGGFEDVLAE